MKTRTQKQTRRARAAFTLIEILLAIAMISILATVVVINSDKFMTNSQIKVAENFTSSSLTAPLMTYKMAMGNYPSTEQGLTALLKAPDNNSEKWKGPYIKNLPDDPWGNPYMYRCPAQKSNEGYDIWSMGPDGKDGTDDDIGNWKK